MTCDKGEERKFSKCILKTRRYLVPKFRNVSQEMSKVLIPIPRVLVIWDFIF